MEKALAEKDLGHFIRQAWQILEPSTPYIHGWHIDAIGEHLKAVDDGEIRRLVINIPPRHMKSIEVGVCWPVWSWIRRPETRWLFSSYAYGLSIRDAVKARRLINSEWYQSRWGDKYQLVGDQNEKCLVVGTQILKASGALENIENLICGDSILSVVDNRIVADRVKHVWCNGKKPIYKIVLSDGSEVRATGNHRFHNWDTWKYVQDMKKGDSLAVVRKLPEPSCRGLSKDDAFLLALWLSEGTKNASSFEVSTTDTVIITRLSGIAKKRDWEVSKFGECQFRVTCNGILNADTPMGVLKRNFGGVAKTGTRTRLKKQCAKTIRIPNALFRSSDAVVNEFIGTYIACDGWVGNGKNHGFSITSISKRLIHDFGILFKRFDVKYRIKCGFPSYTYKGEKKKGQDAWSICVMGLQDVLQFKDLYVYAKQPTFLELVNWCNEGGKRHVGGRNASIPPGWNDGCSVRFKGGKTGWASRHSAISYAEKNGYVELLNKLRGDLDWRAVVSVEEDGEEETWHIETEKTGTFIAEGFFSHNTRYENDRSGFRIATSVGGLGTGEGGDRIVVDDPHNVREGESDTVRAGVILWWDEVMSTRINNPKTGAFVIIMQRVHESDLSGHVLAKGGYTHLCLPARYEPKIQVELNVHPNTDTRFQDPREVPGELLWPERYDEGSLSDIENDLGEYATAGQLQQRPAPREGGIFKKHWWRFWQRPGQHLPPVTFHRTDGTIYSCPVVTIPHALDDNMVDPLKFDQSWDMSFKDTASSDMVVGQTWANPMHLCENGQGLNFGPADVFLMAEMRGRKNFPDTIRAVLEFKQKWPMTRRIWVEDKANGPAVIAVLKSQIAGMIAVDPQGDKEARASACTFAIESGNVYLPHPHNEPWVHDYIDELGGFPKKTFDDRVDCTTQALLKLVVKGAGIRLGSQSHWIRSLLKKPKGPMGFVAKKRGAQIGGITYGR